MAARIADGCPPDAIVARLGGDEFAVAVHTDSLLDAVATADAVLASIRAPIQVRGGEYYLTADVGNTRDVSIAKSVAVLGCRSGQGYLRSVAAERTRSRPNPHSPSLSC